MKQSILLASILVLATRSPNAVADETDVIALKEANFQVTNPNSIDWEVMKIEDVFAKKGMKLHLQSEYADSDPPAACNVYIFATPLARNQAKLNPAKLGAMWKDQIESIVENKEYTTQTGGKIGEVDCWEVDVTGTHAMTGGKYRLSWMVFMNGSTLYQYYVHRSADAVDDADLHEELEGLRKSFKFFEIRKLKADPKAKKGEEPGAPTGGSGVNSDKIDPALLERKEVKLNFWKLHLVKPQGLVMTPTDKFDKFEQAGGCVFKAEAIRGQTRMMIRVYAKSLKGGKGVYSLDKLAESKITYFEKTFDKKKRKKPTIDKKWKCKLAKKSFSLSLLGRRTVVEMTDWYFAECKNDRQYQVQIYYTGGTGAVIWKNHIKDFIDNFVPVK